MQTEQVRLKVPRYCALMQNLLLAQNALRQTAKLKKNSSKLTTLEFSLIEVLFPMVESGPAREVLIQLISPHQF